MSDAYECSTCHGVFGKGWSDEESNAESKEAYGVEDASAHEGFAVICDNCHKEFLKWKKGLSDQTLEAWQNAPLVSAEEAYDAIASFIEPYAVRNLKELN